MQENRSVRILRCCAAVDAAPEIAARDNALLDGEGADADVLSAAIYKPISPVDSHWSAFHSPGARISRQCVPGASPTRNRALANSRKMQLMPAVIGERGGTRTLDPMIKSHGSH